MQDPELALSTAAALRRSVMSLGRRLRIEQSPGGFTSLELTVLGHLHRQGPMTPGDLAAADRVQPQTLTRTLNGLADAGLIQRADHPSDGRRALLEMTDAGLAALRQDMSRRDRWLADAMARSLTSTERELLRLASELLDRVVETPSPSDLPA